MAAPLGATPGILLGAAVGGAAAVALEPVFEPARQKAWSNNQFRILDPAVMARLVAQGGVDLQTAQNEGALEGFSKDKIDALVYLSQTVPGFAQALTLWRRDPDGFADLWTHSLVKEGLDARYLPHLNGLRWDRLSLPVLALGIVRGLVDAPFPLPFTPPTGTGKVAKFPTSDIDAAKTAADTGFTVDDLFLQTAISGRPMGPESAASAVFRNIIERVDYDRAILEGDVRGEWSDAIFETARQIPSVADYINAEIRGWITTQERNDGIARHGMHAADGDLLYKRTGRPATTHQVHIGWARGGRNPAAGTDEKEVFTKAIQESDIRPEWTDLLWSQRYTYPPFFALRSLMQGGVVNQAEGEQILLYIGWEPKLAHDVSVFFTKDTGTAAKENPWLAKAQQRLWTDSQNAYIKDGQTRAVIEPLISTFVTDLADRDAIFQLWNDSRTVTGAPAGP